MSTEVSGSPLADRLVRRGASAISAAYGPATVRKARLALAAGLRELADNEALIEDYGSDWPEALRSLAVSVEEGER